MRVSGFLPLARAFGVSCALAVMLHASGASAGMPGGEIRLAGLDDAGDRLMALFGRSNRQDDAPRQRAVPVQDSAVGQLQFRVDAIEQQMRQLTGQIEQLTYELRRMREAGGQPAGAPPAGGRPAAMPMDGMTGTATPPGANASTERGAPPTTLGTVAPIMEGLPEAGPSVAEGAPPPGTATGQPLDLAAIGRAIGDPTQIPDAGTGATEAPTSSSKDEYDLAYGYILRAEYDLAEDGFRDFLTNHSEDTLAPNAEYWLGESLYQQGEFREAAEAFLTVYTKHGDTAKAPESLARLGLSLARLDEKDAACASFAEFGRKYPRASAEMRNEVEAGRQRAGC